MLFHAIVDTALIILFHAIVDTTLIILFHAIVDQQDAHNSEESLVEFVDIILSDQDTNKDGFITYPEFITFMSKHQQNTNTNQAS